jgi:hypothetical protein
METIDLGRFGFYVEAAPGSPLLSNALQAPLIVLLSP